MYADEQFGRILEDPQKIGLKISPSAEEAIRQVGRTEDIRFSPDNTRIVTPGFRQGSCLILDVEFGRHGSEPIIEITGFVEIRSKALHHPHGIDFIDNNTLIVANRRGWLAVFDLPRERGMNRTVSLEPVRVIKKAGLWRKLKWPGSVCVLNSDAKKTEILVCNNYGNRVTRHTFGNGSRPQLASHELLLENGIWMPDGVTVSPDKRWIAISNHRTRSVLVYDRRRKLNRRSTASGVIFGAQYPHGLRFTPDGKRLIVCDAGNPFIHIFSSNDGTWTGERNPIVSMKVLDDERFAKGHKAIKEGGPKGVDVDAQGKVMVVTCEEQTLAFFAIPAV